MSPEPYVRGQAFVVAALLVVTAALASPLGALVCAAITGGSAWWLRNRYAGDILAARAAVPPHRLRLDIIVAGDVRAAVGVGLVGGGLLIAFPAHRPDVAVPPATFLLLTAVAVAILLSSLVDWYIILPRVSGLLGIRPCRAPEVDHPRFPRTWRETTRWWYIHRIVAALVLRLGLAYAVIFAFAHHISVPGGSSIVTGIVIGSFAAYLAAVPRAVWEAGHPSLIIGRTVRRHQVSRVPRTVRLLKWAIEIPVLKRRAIGELRPREYVYDVALESVQLVPVARRESDVPRDSNGDVVYERDPVKVAVRDASASEPESDAEPFSGCTHRCAGISWYCIDNPRCFATK